MRLRLFADQLIRTSESGVIMPVWLDAIPDEEPKVIRPALHRWLILLMVMLITVFITGVWFWQGPREGIVFWLTLTGLPLCFWGLLFCLRRFAYKTEQVGAESWNRERKSLLERETLRGQQPAWILGSRIEMRAGQDAESIRDTISRAVPVTEALRQPGHAAPVHYAALPYADATNISQQHDVIELITSGIADTLAPLREDLSCWLQIDSDLPAQTETCITIVRQLETQSGRVFSRVSQTGMEGMDHWLDRAAESPSVLVSIAIHLPKNRREGRADAITAQVLANRPSDHYPDAIMLHRPEQGSADTLNGTLQRALLWADISAEQLNGAWMTGQAITQGAAWNSALESCGATFSLTDALITPDHAAGYAGVAAPWAVIALAQSSLAAGDSLAIASQSPDEDAIWVAVVKRIKEE